MAKEFFENRSLEGSINLKLKDYPKPGAAYVWKADKGSLVAASVMIIEKYEEMGHRMTLRQLYYRLVAAELIPNHIKVYKKLSTILDDCRYCGLVDWNSIEDRGRKPFLPYYNDNAQHGLIDTIKQFRVDRFLEQPNYVEVWTEKDAISGVLKRVTSKYHVQLVVNKGYISSSAIHEAYLRFCKEAIENERPVRILYFGDHDPSGLDMVRDIRERLEFFFRNGEYSDVLDTLDFEVVPIGLTMKQIKEYKPPHNPAKVTDPRAKAYIKKFGEMSWEVDALDPPIMTAIVENNILELLDKEQYEERLKFEESEQWKLIKLVNQI